MEKFKDFVYTRPDFAREEEAVQKYTENLKKASSYEEFRRLLMEREEEASHFYTMKTVAYIRNTMDTTDAFYEGEMNAFYEEHARLILLNQEADAAFLASPFVEQFREEFGNIPIQEKEMAQKLANPAVAEDFTKESMLCQEYSRIVSSCRTEFRGEMCSFSRLLKHMESVDRKERREAFQAWADLYASVADELDAVYDKMIALRKGMAKKLGFDSFISMSYARMGRMDYGPEDVALFRRQVLEEVVPFCSALFERQAKRIGLAKVEWYDEALAYPDGNAVPRGTKDEMLDAAQKMYHELSPKTAEFFDFMIEHDLFDLEGRPGKQPGGYCTTLRDEKAPFIFANYNGTSADVDVLTHEAGHAFEGYVACRKHPLSCMVWSTSEINEIHSMSMEFFTYPWMEGFFGDKKAADRYRKMHLETNLEVVPYMVCVDEFQHRVYEEDLDAAGRRRVWKELERTYMPWRSYDGNAFLEGGGFWMQKLHIFLHPFYYIDYALAQMGAFEFYQKMSLDRSEAWDNYYKLCQLGGSRGYFETLEYAGLSNPFQDGTVKKIMQFIKTKL